MTLDLHLHSTVSDGRLSPSALVRLASSLGVTVMALSDHDSTDGVEEAQRTAATVGNLRIIPAIELSTDLPGASVHILGLFLEVHDPSFQAALRAFRERRLERAEQMVDALARLGAPISLERVFEIAGEGSVGRPHVAQALLEAGHIQVIDEAFERFIGRDGPAYFEGFRLEPSEGVRLIHSVGGFAAWAHPNELDGRDWREYLPTVVAAGIDGLEVYYSKEYPAEVIPSMLEACAAHDLLPTVGSDFHGFGTLQTPPGSVASPADLLGRLEARLARIRATAG
ncbi:MAG TPA: PHP domain-containing protein [Chloroflexota bacterium]